MGRTVTLIFLCIVSSLCSGQAVQKPKVSTIDIDNFWQAYDSTQTTQDTLRQQAFIQQLYIDRGTEGLHAFMRARDYSAPLWVRLINRYPKYWKSIRPNTLSLKSKSAEIENSIARFKELYPSLKDAQMYFTVGGLKSGGTTDGRMVLVGSEIATGNAGTDVSEFTSNWLAEVFKEQKEDNIIPLNVHEYVHTQQKGESKNLLGQAIMEGSCDFITELVIGRLMQTTYINYGLLHEKELKESFRKEMFSKSYNNWLYNGDHAETVADLGYFMGYQICKSYYAHSTDKKKAIKEIIELNYNNSKVVKKFLINSGYYTGEEVSKAGE